MNAEKFTAEWERIARSARKASRRKAEKRTYPGVYVYDCLDKSKKQAPYKAVKSIRGGKKMIRVTYHTGDGGYRPEKAHEADAGLDLRSPKDVIIPAHGGVAVNLEVAINIPEGYCGMLKSKSGLNVNYGIRGEGVIDAGYTGMIVAKMYNDSNFDKYICRGDKLIQLVITPVPEVELVEGEMPETERGANGFGSSGR